MAINYIRAYRAPDPEPAEDVAADAPSPTPPGLLFVASTAGVKRDGLVIDQSRWLLDNYRANPVLLWAHDYSRLPIGRAEVDVVDGQLMARLVFDPGDPFASEVERKYRDGILNAVSVGWQDTTRDGTPLGRTAGPDDVWHELFDVSAVPVPGDPAALIAGGRAAVRAMVAELGESLAADDANPDADADGWDATAAAMVAVFDPADGMDDKARRRAYNALLPRYRRAGKVPPEFMTGDDLAALGPDEWSGLWLEGELMNERAGAVLNARNREKLEAARDAISDVLDSAVKAEGVDGGHRRGARAEGDMTEVMTVLMDIKRMLADLVGGADDSEADAEAESERAVTSATDDDANNGADDSGDDGVDTLAGLELDDDTAARIRSILASL